MEHSQTQITDHSSEHIEHPNIQTSEHPEDDLTAILKAKDNQIRILQLGNLCFMNRAKHLEGKVGGLKAGLEEAHIRFCAITQILEAVPLNDLSAQESNGVYLVIKYLAEEAEGRIEHDLAMTALPDTDNHNSDVED